MTPLPYHPETTPKSPVPAMGGAGSVDDFGETDISVQVSGLEKVG